MRFVTMIEQVMTYQDIEIIWPYGTLRIEELEFIQQVGEHARLTLTGMISESQESNIVNHGGSHDRIELHRIKPDGVKSPLFMGQLSDFEIRLSMGIYYITLKAVSHTSDLDVQKECRSFQDVDQLYVDVVKDVISDYKGADVIDCAFGKRRQTSFILQYQETDWQFLIRLATHVGALLIPNVTTHHPSFWIGLPEGRKEIELKNIPYETHRANAPYLKKIADDQQRTWDQHFISYRFQYPETLEIGDQVNREGIIFVITQRVGKMTQGVFQWEYVCERFENVTRGKQYNQTIIGAAINGTIIGISRNQVKLHLELDSEQDDQSAHWFPYAAEGNQAWYLMPEAGAKVKLYFPGADESEAMVIHSVRLEPQGEYIEKSQQKMGNPSVKSFGNPQGKEFTMSESELVMTAKEGSLYISMNGSKGITLNSSTTVHIQSSDSLTLQGNEVHIEAIEALNIITNTDTLDLVEDMNMKSSEITLRALNGYETTYPAILSEFEQQVAEKGIDQVKKERKSALQDQQAKAIKDSAWGFLVGVGNMIKDVGDMIYTTVISDDESARAVYQVVSGEVVAPLNERNQTLISVKSKAEYVKDTVTFQKSGTELWNDAQPMIKGYIDPLLAEEPSLVTGTPEEHYNYGNLVFQDTSNKMDLLGASGFVKGIAFKSMKLAPKGKLPGNRTSTTFKGKLATLLTDAADSKAAKAVMKDGKFKTNASALNKLIDELKLSDMLQGKMVTQLKNNLPFKVVTLTTGNGLQRKILVKNPDYQFTSKKIGEGGGKTGGKKRGNEGTGEGGKGASEANFKNIDDFINGNKKFDDVLDDYSRVYSDGIQSNKPWNWDNTIPGGENLTAKQKKMIKESAISSGYIPDIKVTKVDGLRYGYADFKGAGVVKETVQLPEDMWKLSDTEQFKWLDEKIGGHVDDYTWHHTETPGKMELVPFGIHNITSHNGGRTTGMWADAPR